MLSLRRYTAADRELWDSAVAAARNATFLFLRRYMDYHSDRFRDHSLIFCDGRGTPVALLPANESVTAVGSHTDRHLHSHQGLTYGGFILSPRCRDAQIEELFRLTVADTAGQTVAGTVLFVTPQVVHAQYISASPEGKACGALDLLFLTLIEEYRQRQCHRYFDFGISNERGGTVLNASLLEQKEGFGATGTLHRSFLLRI